MTTAACSVGRMLRARSSTTTGRVFVLIPGYTSSAVKLFANLYRQASPFGLGEFGEVYMFERADEPGCDLGAEAAFIYEFLQRLPDVRQLVIIGHSMGGAVSVKLLEHIARHPSLRAAVEAGAFLALSSPLIRADIAVPLELGRLWLWPRFLNGLFQSTYMRATGRRLNRGTGRAQHLQIRRDVRLNDRGMNHVSNACRRAQLRALCQLETLPDGRLDWVPFWYLQAMRDPLVRATAGQHYLELFGADPKRLIRLPRTWHGELPGQPEQWGRAILTIVRQLAVQPA